MTDIARQQHDALPSGRQLLKLTGIAIAIATVILFTMVLPAEYGIDPTGIGRRMGLASLGGGPAPKPAPQAASKAAPEPAREPEKVLTLTPPPAAGTVWRASRPYRSDELSLTLRPNEGAEIKATMQQGER